MPYSLHTKLMPVIILIHVTVVKSTSINDSLKAFNLTVLNRLILDRACGS